MNIAVVMPVIDEAARLDASLAPLLSVADRVVVVDGGSRDESRSIAAQLGAEVIESERGRAVQMNAGARCCAQADVLVFVHADVVMPPRWREAIEQAVAAGARWGRFDVTLESERLGLRIVADLMNLRSRLTGIATGDQSIFLTRGAWHLCGGWPEVALMEDIRLSSRLRREGFRPACLSERVSVSPRRWERDGLVRTILLMWSLRALHALGVSPPYLHRLYYRNR